MSPDSWSYTLAEFSAPRHDGGGTGSRLDGRHAFAGGGVIQRGRDRGGCGGFHDQRRGRHYRFQDSVPDLTRLVLSSRRSARWISDGHPGNGIVDLIGNPFAASGWNVTRSAAGAGSLVITEFAAINASGFLDEDGDNEAWIEIHNPGPTAVNLSGWSLTDDAGVPGKWMFPNRSVAAGSYLVVFASGKDRRPVSGELHTNFKLGTAGGYLALVKPDQPVVNATEFSGYPAQRAGYGFGLSGGQPRYFNPPTPGAVNSATVLSAVAAVPQPGDGPWLFHQSVPTHAHQRDRRRVHPLHDQWQRTHGDHRHALHRGYIHQRHYRHPRRRLREQLRPQCDNDAQLRFPRPSDRSAQQPAGLSQQLGDQREFPRRHGAGGLRHGQGPAAGESEQFRISPRSGESPALR